MLKEKPRQSKEPVRGSGSDNTTVAQITYNGKIQAKDFKALESELSGMTHGTVSLTISIRDGQLQYSKISKEYTMRASDE